MDRPTKRDGKLFGGFGIFPFSLVLLCVAIPMFVVLTTPTHHGNAVDLPKASTSRPLPGANREDAIKVYVQRDGALYVDSRKVTESELALGLRLAVAQGRPRHAYLSADKRASYGRVKQALSAIRNAGIEDISVVTNY